MSETPSYLYIDHDVNSCGLLIDVNLSDIIERHKRNINQPHLFFSDDYIAESQHHDCQGIVFECLRGWISRRSIRVMRLAFSAGQTVFIYFAKEKAIERIDAAYFQTLYKIYFFTSAYRLVKGELVHRDISCPRSWSDLMTEKHDDFRLRIKDRLTIVSNRLTEIRPRPVKVKQGEITVPGTGVYLRLDYWNEPSPGGSYGHTCYVAKELDRITDKLVCFTAGRYDLLDELGINQVVVPLDMLGTDRAILEASTHYYWRLKSAIEALNPAFIYERLVPGSCAGAMIAQDLKIPYFLEFNGSEVEMSRTFGGQAFEEENLFLYAERIALNQASLVSVVSEPLVDSVLKAGVPRERIIMNPNGADPDSYKPGELADKRATRSEYGWNESDVVVGFVGSFGGWHGIEVIAKALPVLCEENPDLRFLLIGGGKYEHLIRSAIRKHGLEANVILTGPILQNNAIPLLQCCDIFIAPHHRHMKSGEFFGSPTKIFEYMALSGAIIASSIGQQAGVLSPALSVQDLKNSDSTVGDARAVLVEPGDVEEFVSAVSGLVQRKDLWQGLGQNARNALLAEFSWKQHVQRLMTFAQRLSEQPKQHLRTAALDAKLIDKNEIQNQWNNDPCGSHYIDDEDEEEEKSLDWFQAVEHHRYTEYAPWMSSIMEFDNYQGKKVLEIGGGLGTDLAQFAKSGADVTDIDFSVGHLRHAQRNFVLRDLSGDFHIGDAEALPYADNSFDLVYSNGVIHHTPQTQNVVDEILRVLRPGGKIICMVYAQNSLNFWLNVFFRYGIRRSELLDHSVNEIMSREVEVTSTGATPLVKVYTGDRLRKMFSKFDNINIVKRQLVRAEVPKFLRFVPLNLLERFLGWNLIVKAIKSE